MESGSGIAVFDVPIALVWSTFNWSVYSNYMATLLRPRLFTPAATIVALICACGLAKVARAESIFTCQDENGTTVFQNTPCEGRESQEIYRYEPEPVDAYHAGDSGYYQNSYADTSRPNESGSHSRADDARAIAQIQQDGRSTCGTQYHGKSERSLRRSKDIVAKSKSISGREDRREISCHLKQLERIKQIRTYGADAVLRMEAQTPTRSPPQRSNMNSQPMSVLTAPVNQDPQWLLDPYSGTMMPRTGAGYTDPWDGTFYPDVGPGVVNSKTGEFIPTNK